MNFQSYLTEAESLFEKNYRYTSSLYTFTNAVQSGKLTKWAVLAIIINELGPIDRVTAINLADKIVGLRTEKGKISAGRTNEKTGSNTLFTGLKDAGFIEYSTTDKTWGPAQDKKEYAKFIDGLDKTLVDEVKKELKAKEQIKESVDSDKLIEWKNAWKEFHTAASKLSKVWETVDIKDPEFLKAYSDVFDQSFDEVTFEIHDLAMLAKSIKE